MSRDLHKTESFCAEGEEPKAAFVIDYISKYPWWPDHHTDTHVLPYEDVAAERAREEGSFGFWRIKLKTGDEA